MEINYYRKDVYGNTLYYFCDETFAGRFRRITGTKTASLPQMQTLELMFGVKFTEVLPPR